MMCDGDLLDLVRSTERQARLANLQVLINQDHVRVETPTAYSSVPVRVGSVTFFDPHVSFPTIKLMADIALAIVGGETCRKEFVAIHSFNPDDPMQYVDVSGPTKHGIRMDRNWAGLGNHARGATAAVTKKKMKGLRP